MITIVFIIAAIFWILLMTMQKYGGELFINPVVGFMIGCLYDAEVTEEGTEHTVQFLFGIICFTIIWQTNG